MAPDTAAIQQIGGLYFLYSEQINGSRISTATDIYSLGRLLAALIDVSIVELTTEDDALPVFRQTAWRRSMPRDLAAIIDQATRTEPERRYATALAMRVDLLNFLQGRPVDAVPTRFGYRLGKFVRRHRVAVMMATLAVLIGTVMLWRLVTEYERARAAETVATTEALRAQQAVQFLTSMLVSIEPEYADGADTALMQRVLEDAAARAHVELESQPLILSDIEYAIGRAYLGIGLNEPAYRHLGMASELARDMPGDLRYLNPERYLAQLDLLAGNLETGLTRIESVLERAAGSLSPDRPEHLDAMNIRASLLIQMGEPEAAEPIIREVIDRTADATEEFSVNVRLESLRSPAQLQSNTGRFEESIQMLEQLREEAEGWARPVAKRHIIAALNDHGVALMQQQKYVQAEPVLREGLVLQEEYYGATHPRLIHGLNNLAASLRNQGRSDEARSLFERSLALAIDAYGPEQPPTLIIKYNFGNLLRVQGDVVAALEYQRAAFAGSQAVFPPNHIAHGMIRLGLGQTELAAGNAETAKALLQEAVTILTETQGTDFYRTVEARDSLAEARKLLSPAEEG